MTNTNTTIKTLRIDLPTGLAILEPQDNGAYYDLHNLWAELGCPAGYAPSVWVQTDHAKATIKALEESLGEDLAFVKVGDTVPTLMAFEPLVYHYASWACPEYNARVASFYYSIMNGRYDVIQQAMELINSQMDEKEQHLNDE